MKTISQLRKDAKSAPKFILVAKLNNSNVFVGDMRSVTDLNIVTSEDLATKYSVGYDDEIMKCRAWTICAKAKGLDLVFTPMYL